MTKATPQEVKRALDLAVCLLMKHEPGDSRAVSDVAVALASVSCDQMNDQVMPIIDAALKKERSFDKASTE